MGAKRLSLEAYDQGVTANDPQHAGRGQVAGVWKGMSDGWGRVGVATGVGISGGDDSGSPPPTSAMSSKKTMKEARKTRKGQRKRQ